MNNSMTAAAAFLLTATAPALAALAATKPAPVGDLVATAARAPYRLAGVGALMPAAEAEAALREAGYEEGSANAFDREQDAFEELVKARATGVLPPRRRQVAKRQAWGKGREGIDVIYLAYPQGALVREVTYFTNAPSPTTAEITASLRERYGPGKGSQFGPSATWCSPAPCGRNSVVLESHPRGASFHAPEPIWGGTDLNARIEAAARAQLGNRPGSF